MCFYALSISLVFSNLCRESCQAIEIKVSGGGDSHFSDVTRSLDVLARVATQAQALITQVLADVHVVVLIGSGIHGDGHGRHGSVLDRVRD